MAGNVKALTNDELKFVLSKYEFELLGDCVVVKSNHRKTLHAKDESFSLLLPLERRRLKITKKAIDLWSTSFINEYSLVEVQNAINVLLVTSQPVKETTVSQELKRSRSKMDNLYKEGE